MLSLPPALAGLASYPQFVLYRLAAGAEPGKQTKLPCNHQGETIDAHKPQFWMSADVACQWSEHTGFGVAYVFTEHDPFFFLDIDGCLQNDGTWTPLATTLCQAFAGCAVEVSSSGRGLHIMGTGNFGAHAKKNTALNIELYTEKRFVALTGTGVVGDVRTTVSDVLATWLVQNYFRPRDRQHDADWSDEPCEEWRGSRDDADLIRRARQSRSAATVFGGRASFEDLWSANTAVLATAYPSKTSDSFDRSSADMALASHLMFWTGRDCARVERLMRHSALVRDKWDTRVDYLYNTIIEAKQLNRDVCKDRETEQVAMLQTAETTDAAIPNVAGPAVSHLVEGSTYLSPEQQQELFSGCVHVMGAERTFVPKMGLLKRTQFNVLFGGYTFIMDRENNKTTHEAWEAFTNSRALRCPIVHGHCFRPDLGEGQIVEVGNEKLINIYRPVNILMREGDPAPFLTHLEKLLPDERDRRIYLSYLAAIVQHKGVKFRWAPVLQGVEGNGKTFFSVAAEFAIGQRYTHWPKSSKLGAQFNSWMYGKLLYCVEDFGPSRRRDEVIEELKPMITGESLEIEGKGIDQESRVICGNFLFNTNHRGAIRKTHNDRRFAVFYTPQQEFDDLLRDGLTVDYMNGLFHWARGTGPWSEHGANYGFSVIAHYLNTYPIAPEFNPATNCPRAPATSSGAQAVVDSFGAVETEVMEAIAEGRMGFRGGWVSGRYLKEIVDDTRRTLSPQQRTDAMKALGYIEHPAFGGGRTKRPVMPDQCTVVLYIKKNTFAARLTDPEAASKAYEAAQQV